ncbi:hypothetical protein [Natronoglycomyces albus]|uniref:hypothetical protein n=1 Tax=Natronoglycomyces albus TaxID=2811108 RepID=UPI001FE480D2|nr:hypothetical protein [Natronoglycomyces albus]
MNPSIRISLGALTHVCRKLENKLTIPVVVAALASIPAVFLTVWGSEQYEMAGHAIGWAAAIVLWVEFVILLMAARNKREWLRTHKWPLTICLLTLVSLVFAAGGAQILRLIHLMGSIRMLRAKRIWDASLVLRRRMGLNGWWNAVLFGAMGIVVAGFVAMVLTDPTAQHSEVVNWFGQNARIIPIAAAGLILAAATYLVVRNNHEEADERADETWETAVREDPPPPSPSEAAPEPSTQMLPGASIEPADPLIDVDEAAFPTTEARPPHERGSDGTASIGTEHSRDGRFENDVPPTPGDVR